MYSRFIVPTVDPVWPVYGDYAGNHFNDAVSDQSQPSQENLATDWLTSEMRNDII